MRYISCTLIFSIFFAGLIAQPHNAVPQGNSGHNIYAVVVGISQYAEGDNIPALKFAHRDAQEFANFLESRSGGSVPTENIRLLLNENATVAAVYNALTWLTETCKKDDLVYFYFAGHGDKESQTIYDLGFLLTYNTPRPNYKNNAVRIEDLNDYANTLSVRNNANVVLITDACHSGDMNSSVFHWSNLVGEDLRKVKYKEIRIASCGTDQLSAEDKAWGGGRGAFSWYLVNGLKGLADKDGDGIVTVKDIQIYLDSCFARDPVLAANNIKQDPVLSGDKNFKLADVDKTAMTDARVQMAAAPIPMVGAMRALPIQPQDYFFNLFKEIKIEDKLNFTKLDKLPKEDIPLFLVDAMYDPTASEEYKHQLNALKAGLKDDPDKIKRFNEKLAEIIHTRAETVINAYLKGDEAEMERRRYYNIAKNGYDQYPIMFSVAAKLTSPENRLQRILQVDQHYFAGVVARLEIPTVEDPRELIETSFAEQQKALDLDDNAANIQNEMGNLYLLKKEFTKAEKFYQRATQIAPDWAIPWANLCGLYAITKKPEDGLNAGRTADSLQAGLHVTSVSLGYVYENAGNNLFAEEYYRKAIDLNSRHYLPFERLGAVYTNTTQYEAADSFYYEAELRKKGFHFEAVGFDKIQILPPSLPADFAICFLDTNKILKDDVMAFFYWGKMEYDGHNYYKAERIFKKIIEVDKANPLVYHYMGKIFYDQKKWENAEVMFKLAFQCHPVPHQFTLYCDSVAQSKNWPYEHDCFEKFFRTSDYAKIEDNYFIASVYETWGHYEEAEDHYRNIINAQPSFVGAYGKLWRIMESLGRYTEAEQVIKNYGKYDAGTSYAELDAFYKRAIEQYPADANWPYKLGLLLYDKASLPAADVYLDSIVYFPLINKEVFINLEHHNGLVNNYDMLLDRDSAKGMSDNARITPLFELPTEMTLPGTNERMKMAPFFVYTPREDAITYLSKAAAMIKEPETIADINFKIANVYVWAGSKKQAYPYYEMAIKMAPDNGAFRLKMVTIAHGLFRNRVALENMQYLYDQKQINFQDRMLLAEFDIHAGKTDIARKILDEAETIYPYNLPSIHDLRGRSFLLSKQPKQALPWYKQYLAENNNDDQTTYTIARLYAQMGDNDGAWKWLENAMKKGFNYSWVLKYDLVWETYRGSPRWNSLMSKYPNVRTYASSFKN